MSQMPAGWYVVADGVLRWFDGIQWTPFTQPTLTAAAAPIPVGAAPRHEMPQRREVRLWMVLVAGALVVAAMASVIWVLLTAGLDTPVN